MLCKSAGVKDNGLERQAISQKKMMEWHGGIDRGLTKFCGWEGSRYFGFSGGFYFELWFWCLLPEEHEPLKSFKGFRAS